MEDITLIKFTKTSPCRKSYIRDGNFSIVMNRKTLWNLEFPYTEHAKEIYSLLKGDVTLSVDRTFLVVEVRGNDLAGHYRMKELLNLLQKYHIPMYMRGTVEGVRFLGLYKPSANILTWLEDYEEIPLANCADSLLNQVLEDPKESFLYVLKNMYSVNIDRYMTKKSREAIKHLQLKHNLLGD